MKKAFYILIALFSITTACFQADPGDYVDPLDWGMTGK